MTVRPQLPGTRWFLWLRIASLRIGILTGIYLSIIFFGWLVIANRIPVLEPFAQTRNIVATVAMLLLLTIPVLRFHHKPGRLFIAGLTAWTLLTFMYLAAEMRFSLLESRMGGFHILILGAVAYGFVAVLDWVFLICAGVRRHSMLHSQENTPSSGRHGTH